MSKEERLAKLNLQKSLSRDLDIEEDNEEVKMPGENS